jgi:hypothetical protein
VADNLELVKQAAPPVAAGVNRDEVVQHSVANRKIENWDAEGLIRYARENPPVPIIEGLLNVGDVMVLHGTEESFKSVLILQMAESIASSTTLLRTWRVPKPFKVGVIETELHQVMLGDRLGKMFLAGGAPNNLSFLGDESLREWRRQKMAGKFGMIQEWINENGIQVLLIDTANDFFRGDDNPDDERSVGAFFDHLRNLKVDSRILVRHDRKENVEDRQIANTNERIRGSAEWKEDPETIIHVRRTDRRTHEVSFEVGKLRYGRKPEPMDLHFDAGCFRLTPLPPVIAILEGGRHTRRQILMECQERFNLGERKADELINDHRAFLREGQVAHEKSFELDRDRMRDAQWAALL